MESVVSTISAVITSANFGSTHDLPETIFDESFRPDEVVVVLGLLDDRGVVLLDVGGPPGRVDDRDRPKVDLTVPRVVVVAVKGLDVAEDGLVVVLFFD